MAAFSLLRFARLASRPPSKNELFSWRAKSNFCIANAGQSKPKMGPVRIFYCTVSSGGSNSFLNSTKCSFVQLCGENISLPVGRGGVELDEFYPTMSLTEDQAVDSKRRQISSTDSFPFLALTGRLFPSLAGLYTCHWHANSWQCHWQ